MNIASAPQPQRPEKHGRPAIFWTILGALSTLAMYPYLLAINPALVAQVPMPLPVLVIASTAQTTILLLLLSWLGLRLGQPIGLDSPLARALVYGRKPPSVSRRTFIIAVLTGVAGGLLILILDRLFQPFMPPTTQLLAMPWPG